MKIRMTLLFAVLVCPLELRAQAPGSLDATFQAQLPTNFVSQAYGPIAVQPDGKIIVGGECPYPHFGVNPVVLGPQFLARFNSDGALDASFNPTGLRCPRETEPDVYTFASITVQSDGKIVLSGSRFEVPELGQSGLARLNRDGSVDASFALGGWFIWKLALLPGGGYLVAGRGGTFEHSLVRLKHNGELDSAFVPEFPGPDPDVNNFAVQPDGRIVVPILETLIDGQKRTLIRLLPDGSYDPSFAPVTGGSPSIAGTFPDGKLLVIGIGSGLVRLDADGHLDSNFAPSTGDRSLEYVAIQRDGKIILFQYGDVDGSPGKLVRLNTNGSRDETYVSGLGDAQRVYAAVLQPDEKLVVSVVNASGVASLVRLHGDDMPYIVPASIRANSNRTVEFQVTAAANRTVVVESSPNLKSGPWTTLATFPPSIGRETIQFSDSGSANAPQRFYRALSP